MAHQFLRVLIECPPQLQTDFGGRDCDWETFGSVFCLKLTLGPEEYTPIQTYSNGDPAYIQTLQATQYQVKAYQAGFELKISDSRDIPFYVLQRIATLQTSPDRRTKQDLRVFDFVLPEAEDVATARANSTAPYTLRVGAIKPPQAQTGRIGATDGRGWIKGGFTLRFDEKALRVR